MDNLLDPNSSQPRRFGDYVIHGLLGEGGMARVYAAEELLTRRPVAIKVLRSELARSEQGRRQFLTEMAILANLDDPHIVRCLLCTEIEQQPVMVLEQLDGWTLREMLKQRVALPWTEAVSIVGQVARALHTAHSRRPAVVHRDLKPENIMCLRDGRVKVMDFGIAKVLQTLAGPTTQPIGTLQYMSPEHIDARPLDGRADLFALGVTLWEMLAGRPPFASESPRVLLEQICTGPTPALPDHVRQGLPLELERLLGRLLAKDPNERPASAGEVLAILGRIGGGSTTTRTEPVAAAIASAQQLDTVNILEAGAKHPLQRRLEAQANEAVEAMSRFGRATSAWIVRAFVSLMILPAGAAVFWFGPTSVAAVDIELLVGEQGVAQWTDKEFTEFVAAPLLVVTLGCVGLFMWACWAHRRGPQRWGAARNMWLALGGILVAQWAAITAVEFRTESSLDDWIHYVSILVSMAWWMITLSWATGRLASLVLARLERSRS